MSTYLNTEFADKLFQIFLNRSIGVTIISDFKSSFRSFDSSDDFSERKFDSVVHDNEACLVPFSVWAREEPVFKSCYDFLYTVRWIMNLE